MKSLLALMLLASVASGVASLSWPRPSSAPVTRVPVPARAVVEPSSPSRPEWCQDLPPREKFAAPWIALAAGDHAGFVALLREAGCPGETVRASAIAAVGRIHQQRVEDPIREAIRSSKYWQIRWETDGGEPLYQRINRARMALDRELAQLLGVSAVELRRAYRTWGSDESSWVPEASRPPSPNCRHAMRRSGARMRRRWFAAPPGSCWTPEPALSCANCGNAGAGNSPNCRGRTSRRSTNCVRHPRQMTSATPCPPRRMRMRSAAWWPPPRPWAQTGSLPCRRLVIIRRGGDLNNEGF